VDECVCFVGMDIVYGIRGDLFVFGFEVSDLFVYYVFVVCGVG